MSNESKTPRKPKFDPDLGAVCADTWWDFGKLLSIIDNDEKLQKIVTKYHGEMHPDYRPYVTVETVRKFWKDVFSLLQRFYDGNSIKTEVLERLSCLKSSHFSVEESDQFLELMETQEAFWAIEYKLFFEELSKPWDSKDHESGWRNAVSRCEECETFFVKQRKDQIFDTDRCRTKFANRDSYLSRRSSRRGGHRA